VKPLLKHLLVVLLSASISGCVAERLHREGMNELNRGEFEDGLSKLAAAVSADPNNLTFRLDWRARKESAIQQLIALGDGARAAGKAEEAESNYRRVLVIEPSNDRASRGLDAVAADRRHAARTAKADKLMKSKQLELAGAEVRAVLDEDPGFAPAVSLAAAINVAKGPVTAVPHLRSQDSRAVSLQFRDAPTKMVFEVLARQTGINFIFDKDVKSDGKTTIFVNQVSVEQAIDLILTQNQLARQVLAENMVLIYPNTPTKQKDYQDEIVHTFYLTNAAPKDAESMLKTVLGSKTLYVDERSNEITLRDTPEHVLMAQKLIASLDVPEPEVLMEVEVLEISRSLADQLGINYPSHVSLTATSIANPGSTALALADIGKQNSNSIMVSSLGVSADLLKTVGLTNVLSSPRIRAKNKEKARVLVGNRVPVVTSGSSATTGGTYSTSSVQYIDVGLTLNVQPTIHLDGDVAIKTELEVSSILKEIDVPIGNGGTTIAYQIGTRNVSTLLQLKDGETQVLAGLIQDSDQKNSTHIPGLGDLPLLGRLFGSTGTTRDKSEIVLSITPHIIRAQSRPTSESMEFWYGTETQTRTAPFSAAPVTNENGGSTASLAPGGVSYSSGGMTASVSPSNAMRNTPARIDAAAAALSGAQAATAGQDGSAQPAPAASTSAPPLPDLPPKVTVEGPDAAKVGEEVDVVVRLTAGKPPGRLRAQVRFDASALQLVSAEPGTVASSGDSPKVDVRPGGVQLELAGSPDAPLSTNGSIVNLRFRAVSPRPAVVATQVVMLGDDNVAMAATPGTSLKIAVSP
jgi:general secretion pathway protein D